MPTLRLAVGIFVVLIIAGLLLLWASGKVMPEKYTETGPACSVGTAGTAAGAGTAKATASGAGNSYGVAAAAAAYDAKKNKSMAAGWLADTGAQSDIPVHDGSWGMDKTGWGGPGRQGPPPVRAVGGFVC